MNGGNCNICGQPITDASGCWVIQTKDCGINHMPGERLRICAWCKDGLDEAVKTLSEQRAEERKKWRH